ncbi:unnamed protein product, partial [Chrysoparadoxa australica]
KIVIIPEEVTLLLREAKASHLLKPATLEHGGYHALRKARDKRMLDFVRQLVSLLRLDLFTHEVAIGQLRFYRRRKQLLGELEHSIWWA